MSKRANKKPLIVALVGSKGGGGKSTLVCHLSVAAQRAGRRVIVFDTDEQKSAFGWGEVRGEIEPFVRYVPPTRFDAEIAEAQAAGIEIVFLDTAGFASAATHAMLQKANLALLPVRPSGLDLLAFDRSVAIIKAAKVKSAFVLNAASVRAAEIGQAVEVLESHGLPMAGMIGNRLPFQRAVAKGLAVEETSPRSIAALEIRKLWKYVERSLARV